MLMKRVLFCILMTTGVLAWAQTPDSLDRGPVLLETTKKALEMLDNPQGFFLMIEGSQIDDYAHRRP